MLYHKPFYTVILYKIHDSFIINYPGKENTFILLIKDFYGPRYL